jgi:transcriptional regulator with XRE-family HTH domain
MTDPTENERRGREWAQGLKDARNARDLTQQDLAFALGTSVSTIAKWEGGRLPRMTEYLVVRTFFGHGFFGVEGEATRVFLQGEAPISLSGS